MYVVYVPSLSTSSFVVCHKRLFGDRKSIYFCVKIPLDINLLIIPIVTFSLLGFFYGVCYFLMHLRHTTLRAYAKMHTVSHPSLPLSLPPSIRPSLPPCISSSLPPSIPPSVPPSLCLYLSLSRIEFRGRSRKD